MRPALAIALISSSLLATEVVLARMFALWFRASYVYLVVSGATCGLALGAFLVQGLGAREKERSSWIDVGGGALAGAIALPVLLLALAGRTRFDLLDNLPLVLGLTLLVFAIGGALLAALFRANVDAAGSLYAADLGAAALGAPLALLLLDRFGAVQALLALSAECAAIVLFLSRGRRTPAGIAIATLSLSFAALGLGGGWSDSLASTVRPPESNPFHPAGHRPKELFLALSQGSQLVRTDWNSVARSDVVLDRLPGPAFRIFMDGAVPTPMEAWGGSAEEVQGDYASFIGMLPYRVARRAPTRVLAIGAGGGLDVLLALANGANEVEAVDVNPALPSIVADPRYRETWARIYADPRVRLRIEEGRSLLQRSGLYDVIYAACALTNTLQGGGASVVENHLYTVEAFEEYWRHLSPDGLLALVVEDNKLADRIFLTALLAVSRVGIVPAEAADHLLTAHASEGRSRVPYRHILVMSRRAWEPSDAQALVGTIMGMRLEPRHVPHAGAFGALGAPFDPAAPPEAVAARMEAQYPGPTVPSLWPVTDDRPFFVDFGRQLDPAVARLLAGVLCATAVAALTVLLLGRCVSAPRPATGAAALCFACLGIGFMAVETVLIQKLGLPLGYPTRALAVGLGALLSGGALGSLLSQRWESGTLVRRARLACVVVVAGLVVCRLALPSLLHVLAPLPLPARMAGVAALVATLGVPMGVPFSAVLRLLGQTMRRLIPALWGLNGVASMLGAVGTVALAKFWGYQAGVTLAIAAYALAWLALPALADYPLRATRHAAQ